LKDPLFSGKLHTLLRLLRNDRKSLLTILSGRRKRLFVYVSSTDSAQPVTELAGAQFRALSDADLLAISSDSFDGTSYDEEFRNHQKQCLKTFGKSYAYGVYMDGALAHISWMLPPDALSKEYPLVLNLAGDEAEITVCETLEQFRGRRIYPYAIQKLLEAGRRSGIRKIYMKTDSDNTASQAGIQKAGLKRIGTVTLLVPPAMPARVLVWRRLKESQ